MKNLLLFIRIQILIVLVAGAQPAFSQTSDYCPSWARYSTYFWIDSLDFPEQSLFSGQNGGYYEHDEMITVNPGLNTLDLVVGYRSYNYPVYWRGWIDFNGDLAFSTDEIVFNATGRTDQNVQFEVPETVEPGITTMRISMKYGGYPSPCEIYSYGETEDLPVVVETTPSYPFKLTLDHELTVYRDGALYTALTWVVEMDGEVVLRRNASGETAYTYYRNYVGSDYRVWLEQFVDGEYQQVSNIVNYSPGITDQFELSLDEAHVVTRSGNIGDAVQWVIEKDGQVVLQRNAANELDYAYYNNVDGSHYRIWLQKFIDGQYEVVSNIVEYDFSATGPAYELTVDATTYLLQRSGSLGDAVQWVIEKDGIVVLERNAANELNYTYYNHTPGAQMRAWLQQYIDGEYRVVSNVVEYEIPGVYDYSLTLASDYTVTRSGSLGENVQWVVIKDGKVVLQRLAANELSYRYYSNTPGSSFEIYLQKFVSGAYRQVSNSVTYTVN